MPSVPLLIQIFLAAIRASIWLRLAAHPPPHSSCFCFVFLSSKVSVGQLDPELRAPLSFCPSPPPTLLFRPQRSLAHALCP